MSQSEKVEAANEQKERAPRIGSFMHWLSTFEIGEVRIKEYPSREDAVRDHRSLFNHNRFKGVMKNMRFSGSQGLAVYSDLNGIHILRVERTS
jgi:hypothetical protein